MNDRERNPIPPSEEIREQLARHLEQARLLRRQLRLSETAEEATGRSQRRVSRYQKEDKS
jgi:hypothetical protein